MKRVLVACEYSGVVREAFRRRGFDAWSCDLEPADDGSVHHFHTDVKTVVGNFKDWDLVIAHPPCTYLCNSGVRWLVDPCAKDWSTRWQKMADAYEFFMWFVELFTEKGAARRLAIENPISHKHAGLPKYTQIIQPWMFGHPETKATCLWLYNLPKLEPTDNVKQYMDLYVPKSQRSRIHYMSPGPGRSKARSKTYTGIAEAMADQWGKIL
jgi:hypothetical protein